MPTEATPPTKEQLAAWKRDSRRTKERHAALDLAVAARLAAEAELRRASANAVQGAWPQDIEFLSHILWPSLSKCAETTLDAVAATKLKLLGSKFSVRRYSTCIAAILEEVCSGTALWNSAKHIHDTIGETSWAPADQTKRMLARLMTEMLGGTHVDSLEDRVRAVLLARIGHWEAAAMEKQVSSEVLHSTGSADLPTGDATESGMPKLDLVRINKFIKDEGYDNKELASALGVSPRTASSLRNDGKYHGADAVARLAGLMKCESDDLYLQ